MAQVGPGDPGDYYDDYQNERGAVAQACDEIDVLRAEVERLTRQAEMDITAGLAVSRLLGEKDAEIERMRSFLAARHLLVDYNLLQEKFKRQRG